MPIIFGITFWFKIVSHSAMGKKSMHYTWHYIVTKDPIDSKPWSVTLNYQTDDESATFKKTISHLIYWLKYFLLHCCCFPLIFVHQNFYQVIVLGCILFKCHLANETLSLKVYNWERAKKERELNLKGFSKCADTPKNHFLAAYDMNNWLWQPFHRQTPFRSREH